MPWYATREKKARTEFVILADRRDGSFTKLCAMFGISRVTGYRWLNRYRQLGDVNNLGEMPRRPKVSPNKTNLKIENKVLELRDSLCCGARRLSALLKHDGIPLGAVTIHRILRRNGRIPMTLSHSAAWMLRILLAPNPDRVLEQEFPKNRQISGLAQVIKLGRPRDRRKAIVVIGRLKGIPSAVIAGWASVNYRTVGSYFGRYRSGGSAKLFPGRKPRFVDHEGDKRRLFALLHSPPAIYGINRTTWKLEDLRTVLANAGHRMSRQRIPILIKAAGFRWRKAKVVLTSSDPDYSAKVAAIKAILANLTMNEAFFSIDEFGPFAIAQKGGRKRVGPGENYQVPQFQKSKGWTIITAALELSRNQVTHFYSMKKNTDEMIRMAELLRSEYRACTTIYLSWDAASWHVSKNLIAHLEGLNQQATRDGYPILKCAPLPAGSQFLNVIESVFSGMARAIIHNSDYPSVEAAKCSIDRYFAERNAHFSASPQRAGNKIWGRERASSEFSEAHNCKDPRY
jgi:transposase